MQFREKPAHDGPHGRRIVPVVFQHVLPVTFTGDDAEKLHVGFELLPARRLKRRRAFFGMLQEVDGGFQEVVTTEIADFSIRVTRFFRQIDAIRAPVFFGVRNDAHFVLCNQRALVKTVVPQFFEVLGPHVIMKLIPPVKEFGVGRIEPVEVSANRCNGERHADEFFPSLRDRPLLNDAITLVEDASRRGDGDRSLDDIDRDFVIVRHLRRAVTDETHGADACHVAEPELATTTE
ncbi:MAG: hypothetical protein IPM54_36985 [Polyangiaceae bacterium]|nr:hypothetical protein [Polyangiaceae bacterium]